MGGAFFGLRPLEKGPCRNHSGGRQSKSRILPFRYDYGGRSSCQVDSRGSALLWNGGVFEASFTLRRTSFLSGNKHPVAVIPAHARAWLALFRPPNFLTVPGDVLAGFFLAGGATVGLWQPGLVILVLSALLFYAAGLLLNDWADAAVDRMERPDRPIPSGLVSRGQVLAVASALLAGGLGLCLLLDREVFLVGLALALAIGSYNLFTKRFPLIGPINMGLCRGCSFLLGAVWIVGWDWPNLVWWGSGVLVLYITAVTHLARREVGGRYFALERWFPATVVAAAFFVYLPFSELIHWPSQVALAICFFLAFAGTVRTAWTLPDRRGLAPGKEMPPTVPTPALIGRLIALLLPMQAGFVVAAADGRAAMVVSAVLLALWPAKRSLGKIFYSS